MTDKRLGNGAGRTQRSEGNTRRSRKAIRKAEGGQNRVGSEQELVDKFRMNTLDSVLPEIPPIPGYHLCWLTTQNPRDSIASRAAKGYEPVRPEEVPGGKFMTVKTGDYGDVIGIQEMVLYKLPLNLYEAYMRHNHHDEPLREEGKLSAVRDIIEQEAAGAAKRGRKGVRVEVEEGNAEFEEVPSDPGSFEAALTTRVPPDPRKMQTG